MHELSVTQSILEIALRHAEEAEATQVTDLFLVVGQLSSILDDSVQFYWNMISKDTIAQDATLHFRRIPLEMACVDCSQQYAPAADDFVCPACGSQRVCVVAGEEFYLEAIEVQKAPLGVQA